MSARRVGPWTVMAERTVFDNPWISVIDHDVVHPGGSDGGYGVVRFKHAAIGILPIDEEGCVRLVGQHRFPLDAYSWELPEGGGPLDEAPLEAARRELQEETGITARCWLEIAAFDISNSVTDERAVCYAAWELEEGDAAPEPSELLDYRRVPFAALLDKVLAGEIRDSLTVVMTLAIHAKALRGDLPEPISRLVLESARGEQE
ncbi:MAG: NUDIX domain-containing protein [Parvularculaceae bacterium]